MTLDWAIIITIQRASRPHRVHLTIPELQLAELEEDLMLPTLRRNESFLARTFRLSKETLPKWLLEREVEGRYIHVVRLLNGDAPIGEIRARLVWDGPSILLSRARLPARRYACAGASSV